MAPTVSIAGRISDTRMLYLMMVCSGVQIALFANDTAVCTSVYAMRLCTGRLPLTNKERCNGILQSPEGTARPIASWQNILAPFSRS